MQKRFIPVAAPVLVGNEKDYVLDCLDTNWVSSVGKYIERFESAFAEYCGVKHAIACCNGTVALHLALLALDVQPGDEVIVPSLTFIATANTVTYCGAKPVFADSTADTWTIDPADIERKITAKTKGIIAVHLYGQPADMEPIRKLAAKHGLFVLEDAAEAHGALYKGQKTGGLGDLAAFSFYGNKIITCGEGGMVVTNDETRADQLRLLKGQGMDPKRRYWFPIIGYNYRMTNVQAAIGLAQLEKIDWQLERRAAVAAMYKENLRGTAGLTLQSESAHATHVYWMFNVLLDGRSPDERDAIARELLEKGIETRPIFYPLHQLPPYVKTHGTASLPHSERIAATGLSLPTWAGLETDDVRYVCETLTSLLAGSHSKVSQH